MNSEHTLPDGQFMGNTVHRLQHLAPNRSFTSIPVDHEPMIGHVENVRFAQQNLLGGTSVTNPLAHGTAIHTALAQSRRGGKSLWRTILDRYARKTTSKHTVPASQADVWPTYMMAGNLMEPESTEPPHPCASACAYASPAREVPVFRLDVSPAFYMSDEVGAALENSISSVCSGHSNSLSGKVRGYATARYEKKGIYKPDLDPTVRYGNPSIFDRESIPLPNSNGTEWVLDMRFTTGVYRINGHEWLGVFVHGIANASLPPENSQTDPLLPRRWLFQPTTELEQEYALNHRGQIPPRSLFFDMFVPVEPEIVTSEWGWGSELEQLIIDKTKNAMIDTKATPEPPSYITNAWDRKAKHHKSATQIAADTALREHRDYELCLRIELATEQRERARRVLYKYSWKAILLAIIECKQLTVEKI